MDEKKVVLKGSSNKYLWMKVNSGTKMKNVLGHALKHFPKQYDKVIWTGAGQAVGKVISCVELFKKKNPGLHQVTKLRYIDSNNEASNTKNKQQIPEINIFLSQEAVYGAEPGYPWAFDVGIFQNTSIHSGTSQGTILEHNIENMGAMSSTVAEEFAALGLKTSQKRSRRYQTDHFPIPKKNKSAKKQNPTGLC